MSNTFHRRGWSRADDIKIQILQSPGRRQLFLPGDIGVAICSFVNGRCHHLRSMPTNTLALLRYVIIVMPLVTTTNWIVTNLNLVFLNCVLVLYPQWLQIIRQLSKILDSPLDNTRTRAALNFQTRVVQMISGFWKTERNDAGRAV